jgi:glycosyltransferase involved in cell wall biosynthesis
MDILFIQHGDYGEAYKKMLTSQKETYRDQFRSVKFLRDIAEKNKVRVISFCSRPHTEQLEENLWSIGIEKNKDLKKALYSKLASFKTDLLICRTPHLPTLRWAAKNNIITLPCFADTFTAKSFRSRLKNYILRRVLERVEKPCIANHSLNASKSLMLLGVNPHDIVPWDWSPIEFITESKSISNDDKSFSLMYIGVLSKAKGVDTVLESMAILKNRDIKIELDIAGNGDIEFWKNYAKELGIASQVNFLGIVPSDSVLQVMRNNTAVVVPSKHEYPEGLPNTIYEALASRSPLIISDHPAFKGRLKPYSDCLSFAAGNANDLAEKLLELKTNSALYELISKNTEEALQELYIGEDWCDLITLFINDPENKTQWTNKINLRHFI